MNPSLLQRIDRLGRALTPVCLCLLLILLTVAPIRVPYLVSVAPLLPLMAVYHFGLFRPGLLPHWAVLLLGLLLDILSGGPLGVNALIFVTVRHFVAANQRFLIDKSFVLIWFGYALVSAGAVACSWALVAFLMWLPVDPRPAVFQYLVSLAIYPLAGWVLGRAQGPATRAV